jgi:hypothetical protein
MISCLIVWSVLTAWQSDHDWEVVYYKYRLLKRAPGDRILPSVKRFTLGIFRPKLPHAHPTPQSGRYRAYYWQHPCD